jgi:serine/threonine protein kinase
VPISFYLCTALTLDLQMPSHILTVYLRSDPSKRFIAKKVHEQSNELGIFKLLNTFQSKSEHIISLHESFQTPSTSWAILPEMSSVARCVSIASGKLNEKVVQVCWGLIKGVAYLHKFRIAHRDIKPENLVLDRNFSLKIIDFDVAMRVEGEDEMVEGQCGTKGWMAPEIGEKSMYSPIKADRWSTGRCLLYLLGAFRKEDMVLSMTARKLTAYDPEQRPSMLQVAAPFSDVSDVADVAVERKVLCSLQNTVGVDGENAKPPGVKRQKLSVPDEKKREPLAEFRGSLHLPVARVG